MTDNEHRDLELRCVREGTFIREDRSVRMFYLDTGSVVGASEGKETTIVYAEWHRSGAVHGSPITKEELRKLGVEL